MSLMRNCRGRSRLAECNPVTNDPCNTAGGGVCDVVYTNGELNGFKCYQPPNNQGVCDSCVGSNGPFCKGANTCFTAG